MDSVPLCRLNSSRPGSISTFQWSIEHWLESTLWRRRQGDVTVKEAVSGPRIFSVQKPTDCP